MKGKQKLHLCSHGNTDKNEKRERDGAILEIW